jgi:hypothetical protein
MLIPQIQNSILQADFVSLQNVPRLVRIIIDNYERDGLQITIDRVLSPIQSDYFASASSPLLDLYLDIVCSVPTRYRDDLMVELIERFGSATTPQSRILAANLIPLVRKAGRVTIFWRQLADDPDQKVRLEIIKKLPDCHFNCGDIESILNHAGESEDDEIRRTVALVVGTTAPQMINLYLKLLRHRPTMESALESLKLVCENSGFEILFRPFRDAIEFYPEKCTRILLQLVPIADPKDHMWLYKAARRLRHCHEFIKLLHFFSRFFDVKRPFLKFFKVSRMNNWKERLLYAEQCVHFVDCFGDDLLVPAFAFAHDEAECVRAQAVEILVEIYRNNPECGQAMTSLLKSPWQQRMVLAKVMTIVGIKPWFERAARVLKRDAVFDVRISLQSRLRPSMSGIDRRLPSCRQDRLTDIYVPYP